MVDREQAARIIDSIRRDEQKCRECKHILRAHPDKGMCISPLTMKDMCMCWEFVPPENLDYIEWLAKKRGLV